MGIIESIIVSLIPILVQEASKILGSPSENDHSWVSGFVDDVMKLIEGYIPGWAKPAEESIKPLIIQAVQKALSEIKK